MPPEVSSLSSMSPGDVIAWHWNDGGIDDGIDHVTLYLGNGEIAAHSSSCLDVPAATWYSSTEPNWTWKLIHINDGSQLLPDLAVSMSEQRQFQAGGPGGHLYDHR